MIRFEQIEIKYGDFVAIRDLNLHIKEGEFFTFLGPSGCGKTTSLRTLVGFITPSKGKIKIADKEVTHLPVEKREIGMVFQSYALFPTMSVYDNIAFGLRVQKLSKDENGKKVRAVAAKIKITDEQLKKKCSGFIRRTAAESSACKMRLYWNRRFYVWMSRCQTLMQIKN